MANEHRILTDFIGGLVDDNPLTDVATTMNSGGLAAVPAVGTSSYFPITIDPDGLEGAPEVVFITAHTAGASSATIVRGRGGTTNVAHSQNIPWVHGIRSADFPNIVDARWAGDTLAGGPYDYEFEAVDTALPSGFTWFNQGTATYEEKFGAGVLHLPAESGWNIHAITRPMPTPATWTLVAKLGMPMVDAFDTITGLVLLDSVSGHFNTVALHRNAGGFDVFGWTSPSVPTSRRTGNPPYMGDQLSYLKLHRNSATSYDFYASPDGLAWMFAGNFDPSVDGITADRVGFGGGTIVGQAIDVSCHWMRVR